MSWQPPDTDPSPEPGPPGEPAAPDPVPVPVPVPVPEPDTETARVPWDVPVPSSPPPGANGPSVLWAAPTAPVHVDVPGAPNLVFSDTASRFVAYLIDGLLVAIVGAIVASIIAAMTVGPRPASGDTTSSVAFSIMFALVSLAYYVFFWTGGRRATPGQRLFKIQVGNAFDGRPLTATQATKRWLALGYVVTLFGVVPSVASLANLVAFVWAIVLLVTTVQSPTKQGLHDRFANSAVVRPKDGSQSGWAMACLVIVLVLVAIAFVSVVALIFLGTQVSGILKDSI